MNCRSLLPLLLISALPAAAADFKKDIVPILEASCYKCHSNKTGKKKAGYVFDDLETLKLDINPKGAIVPGSPGESHFFEVIADPNHDAHMPPDENLPPDQLQKLREWITEGASLDGKGAKMVPTAKKGLAKPGLPPIMTWTNFEGKKIKAGFLRLEGENVILKMPANAQEMAYPLSKLDAASQQQAKDSAQ
ncbi:MAG: c-type cytochrome domain-containing protein [Verrucomicrobiota bacterium]